MKKFGTKRFSDFGDVVVLFGEARMIDDLSEGEKGLVELERLQACQRLEHSSRTHEGDVTNSKKVVVVDGIPFYVDSLSSGELHIVQMKKQQALNRLPQGRLGEKNYKRRTAKYSDLVVISGEGYFKSEISTDMAKIAEKEKLKVDMMKDSLSRTKKAASSDTANAIKGALGKLKADNLR